MKNKVYSLIVILLGVIVLTGCNAVRTPNSTGTNTASGNTANAKAADLEKNITSSAEMSQEGKLIVFAKNGNKQNIELTVEVEFYDENGTVVGSGKENLYSVGANSEIAVEIYDTPSSFSKYEVYTDAEATTYIKDYSDQIEISHNKTDSVVAQVKNNSSDTISSMQVAIVFYNGEKVVGYDYEYASDVKAGRSGNFSFTNPYDRNYDDLKYDNYKIYVNSAYSYTY